ncbi:hypothetical protein [Calothrix sp. CCY 0018]|uniref:hypothetical protein n=1 Tax=Calothrix sp. CCY 0018 TaxID=3103864 RepID=UPI0039C663D4
MTNSHRTALSPWAIFRWLPSGHPVCIGRFRKRGDAEEHLRLHRISSPSRMEIVFDLPASAHDQTD